MDMGPSKLSKVERDGFGHFMDSRETRKWQIDVIENTCQALAFEGIQNKDITSEESTVSIPSSIVVDHFYSARQGLEGGQRHGTSHEMMMRAILYGLLKQLPHIFSCVKDKFRSFDTMSNGSVVWLWQDLEEVFKLLNCGLNLPRNVPSVIVLLDAMDESNHNASKGTEGSRILRLLSEVAQRGKNTRGLSMKIIICSRLVRWIEEGLPVCQRIDLEMVNQGDIRDIVATGISDLQQVMSGYHVQSNTSTKFRKKAELLEQKELDGMSTYLKENARGVMLWVVLILAELKSLVCSLLYSFK
jgi:hypothetical protein